MLSEGMLLHGSSGLVARLPMPAYVSIRQHPSAYVSIRHGSSGLVARLPMPAYVSIRQHTSAYVSIRQHTSCGAKAAWPGRRLAYALTCAGVC
jgi:hypothetical protein